MAEPKADLRDVDEAQEAQEAFCRLVVAGGNATGVFQLVEAPFDEVAQFVESAIDGDAQLSGFPHGDDWHDIACFHGFANVVRVIAPVREKDAMLGQGVVHDQVEAQLIRCLPRRDVRPHGQACTIDVEVDLGRKATARTSKTLSWSPPFAPAA